MRRLAPTGNWWMCSNGCKELRHGDPERNFGLMLLGFCHKAARP
jgi:hypothetical protein